METYHGHVRTPADAIKLFEACRIGLLQRVRRRLSEKERQAIKSGSVFVWDEREAGMRRWTDGKNWSPSRVSGSFLTYREMDGKRGGPGSLTSLAPKKNALSSPENVRLGDEDVDEESLDELRYKPDGLMKQTFSITTSTGQNLHLISYYSRTDPNIMELSQPMTDPHLRHVTPSKGIYPESVLYETQNLTIACPAILPCLTNQKVEVTPSQPLAKTQQQPYSLSKYSWPSSPIQTPSIQNQSLCMSALSNPVSSYATQCSNSIGSSSCLSPTLDPVPSIRTYDYQSSSNMNNYPISSSFNTQNSGQSPFLAESPLISFDKSVSPFWGPLSIENSITSSPDTSKSQFRLLYKTLSPFSNNAESVNKLFPAAENSTSSPDLYSNLSSNRTLSINRLVNTTESMQNDSIDHNNREKEVILPSDHWRRREPNIFTQKYLDKRNEFKPERSLVLMGAEDQRAIRVLDRKFCV